MVPTVPLSRARSHRQLHEILVAMLAMHFADIFIAEEMIESISELIMAHLSPLTMARADSG